MADPVETPLTKADVLKHFAKKKVQVRIAVKDGKGNHVRDPKTKRIVTEMVSLGEDHITSHRDLGDQVVITTVDGQKHHADKQGK
jgi:hypothetical protein